MFGKLIERFNSLFEKLYSKLEKNQTFNKFFGDLHPDVFKNIFLAVVALILLGVFISITSYYKKNYVIPLQESRQAINNLIIELKKEDCCETSKEIEVLLKQFEFATNKFGEKLIMKNWPSKGKQILASLNILKTNLEKFKEYIKKKEKNDEQFKRIRLASRIIPSDEELPKLKTIIIVRRFDRDRKGNGYYDAVDMNLLKKIVVIGKPEQMSKYPFGQELKLWLEYEGDVPLKVTYGNAFRTYTKTEYYDCYKIIPKSEHPEKFIESAKKARKMVEENRKQATEERKEIEKKINDFMKTAITPKIKEILLLTGGRLIK